MFGSIFGKRKKKKPSYLQGKPEPQLDDTIRSARVGDVVLIEGFSLTFEDAYFVVEQRNRYENQFGEWFEFIGADGDRRVGIEWSDKDGGFVSVTEQREPMGLSVIGLDHDALVQLDEEQSIENFIEYEGQRYFYVNSYEAYYYKDGVGDGDGFYMWEFAPQDRKSMVSVVKWEGMPFEVYTSVVVAPEIVSVYKK